MTHTTAAWKTLVTYVDGLTADQWTEPRDAAGWSVKDHVSHVTQWDRAVIAALRNQVPMRETLGISETAWSAGSFDPMNEEIRHLADTEGVDRVKADRDATWTDLVALMGELSEEQLSQSGAEAGLAVGTGPLDRTGPARCSLTTGADIMRSTCRISRPSSRAMRPQRPDRSPHRPYMQFRPIVTGESR